jgi:hypothetical protein
MKTCFECGREATENHHVIPKSLGGTKTIPLCTICHMKVHDLHNTKRVDNSAELVKRGMDKIRVWDLFIAYQAIYIFEAETVDEIINVFMKEFQLDYPKNRVETLMRRLNEMDDGYVNTLFDKHIGEDLSHIWNEERMELKLQLTINAINEYVNLGNFEMPRQSIEKLCKEVEYKFLEKIKNN